MPFDARVGMEAAIDAARQALAAGELPIGAAVVMNGEVVSSRYTEDVTQGRRLVHADFLALDDADRLRPSIRERTDARLFVSLEPCLFCIGAATAFGVGEVHYALESPTDGASDALGVWSANALAVDGYSIPTLHAGLMRPESLALIRDFVSSHSSGGLWRWACETLERLDRA